MNILNYITELYVCIDDFFKALEQTEIWEQLPKWIPYNKGRQKQLSISEVVTLNLIRILTHVEDLKSFHKQAKYSYKSDFPYIPNYENFLKMSNETVLYVIAFLQYLLYWNRKTSSGIKAIDSTKLPVCKNSRIKHHKVCREIAERGKTHEGWFYGLKLHGICDEDGKLLSLSITSGNIDDRKEMERLFEGMQGLILGDAGYLSNKEILECWLEKNIFLFTSVRNNMKKLMTPEQHDVLKKREMIETVWSVLKVRLHLVTSLARSVWGLIRHYLYSILAYFFRDFDNRENLLLINR